TTSYLRSMNFYSTSENTSRKLEASELRERLVEAITSSVDKYGSGILEVKWADDTSFMEESSSYAKA
ncbi:12876_t:CDS:2, partial [Dentiscutata erythropus]